MEFSRLTHNPDTTRDWKIPMDGPTKKYGKAAFFGPIWGGPAMQDKLDSSNTFPILIHYIHLYYWLVVSVGKDYPIYYGKYKMFETTHQIFTYYTIWLFNIAMENHHF